MGFVDPLIVLLLLLNSWKGIVPNKIRQNKLKFRRGGGDSFTGDSNREGRFYLLCPLPALGAEVQNPQDIHLLTMEIQFAHSETRTMWLVCKIMKQKELLNSEFR